MSEIIAFDDYLKKVPTNMRKIDQVSTVVMLMQDYLKAAEDKRPEIAAVLGIEGKKIDRKACVFHDEVFKTSKKIAELHA